MIPLMYTELSGASIWCFHIECPHGAPWGWLQWLRAPQQAADLSPSGVPSLEEKLAGKKIYDKPRQRFKKQRLYFEDKGVYSQSYGFSSSHVWMWELDYKEGWVLKNWCFWTWESLGQQGDPTRQSSRKSILNIHWKDWYRRRHSNILATWCEEVTH